MSTKQTSGKDCDFRNKCAKGLFFKKGILNCIAGTVCCVVLQCGCYSVLQCVAVGCSALQCFVFFNSNFKVRAVLKVEPQTSAHTHTHKHTTQIHIRTHAHTHNPHSTCPSRSVSHVPWNASCLPYKRNPYAPKEPYKRVKRALKYVSWRGVS